ncbi:MAG TPA: hypothetical protein PLK24_05635 [Atribacter sp.]|jgi:hypothetical protein|uniref:Uncharacterized protein n=1 Tax=Candidatus Atribacter allofermentans TaxID=1852833 RepID=A0A1V5T0I1_9BACT|nr:hypothetical protein [Atribacter sp.]OQA60023.1 MAG: hypothetical protein BWY41_00721 [Candidatus Atribacteria bacterium ADurb.Bin276]HQK83406.1 hypothetical protein [Atribacter sp.]
MKILSLILLVFFIPGAVFAHSFSEIPSHHWSIQALHVLESKYSPQLSIQNLPSKKTILTRFECARAVFEILKIVSDKIALQQEIPSEDINQLEKLVREFSAELSNRKLKKEILIQIFGENHEIVQLLTNPEIKSSNQDEPLSVSGEYTLSYEVYFPPDPQHYKIKPRWKDELQLEINLKLSPSVSGKLKLSIPDVLVTPQPNY